MKSEKMDISEEEKQEEPEETKLCVCSRGPVVYGKD